MTTTLEKAARALSESLANEGVTMDGLFLGDLPTFAVIAVLKAIREPSEGMTDAARKAPLPLVHLDSQKARESLVIATQWQAMLDTITEGQD